METTKTGIKWERLFGDPAAHPFEKIRWVKREIKITSATGDVIFAQEVVVPEFWSDQACRIAASKYFRVPDGGGRECSVRQLIGRVANTIAAKGFELGYFDGEESRENFERDIAWLTLHQYMAFNSPVWFNVGIEDTPQCSACFILSVEDDMHSILKWYETEGMIFKQGSGAGANISALRSSKESLSRGGMASGPVSFMHGADSVANVIRSGGATRRAAKMVTLNVGHPDVRDFVRCKMEMEKMAQVLAGAGFDNSLDGNLFSIYTTLPYQNANNSVRVIDEFMEAVLVDGDWHLKAVTTGEILETVKAKKILRDIAEAAWFSADPGMQFDTTINRWHTCPNSGRINGSNPCSEYMHLDDSACNLASLNLLKFLKEDGSFDIVSFRNAVDATILAQEIIVGFSSYPTPEIEKNARAFRELGIGYTNLGALLMLLGLPYDSDEGRTLAAGITALMTGEAYRQSILIAQAMGPCEGFLPNREPILKVLKMHLHEARLLVVTGVGPEKLLREAESVWSFVYMMAGEYGVRNTQTSVLAPTGTISFMMDCETTGIEPDIALVKHKKLVGGGQMAIENRQVGPTLKRLGYSDTQIVEIVECLKKEGAMEGAPHIREEHLPIFDCAVPAGKGTRFISWQGHVKMMAAVQPFLSGAISKTVNLPAEATVEDFENAFIESWKLGLKAVAFYRDGSKGIQPLTTKQEPKEVVPIRKRLSHTRKSITHKFSVAGHEGYLTVGMYDDGRPGEIFLQMSKEGSTLSGLADSWATSISIALQYGVPLKVLVQKFKDRRFEPSGMTENAEIRFATSISDYVFRWLGMRFLSPEEQEETGLLNHNNGNHAVSSHVSDPPLLSLSSANHAVETGEDGKTCQNCGTLMQRSGSCYTCPQCGANSGCG